MKINEATPAQQKVLEQQVNHFITTVQFIEPVHRGMKLLRSVVSTYGSEAHEFPVDVCATLAICKDVQETYGRVHLNEFVFNAAIAAHIETEKEFTSHASAGRILGCYLEYLFFTNRVKSYDPITLTFVLDLDDFEPGRALYREMMSSDPAYITRLEEARPETVNATIEPATRDFFRLLMEHVISACATE